MSGPLAANLVVAALAFFWVAFWLGFWAGKLSERRPRPPRAPKESPPPYKSPWHL